MKIPATHWHINTCWNRPGERTAEIIWPMLYDGRVHCGFSLCLMTVGFWRWARDEDYEAERG